MIQSHEGLETEGSGYPALGPLARLRRRLSRPLTWAAWLVVTAALAWSSGALAQEGRDAALTLATSVLSAATLVWLAPLPWQWAGAGGGSQGFFKGLLFAFASLEIWVCLVALTYAFVKSRFGSPIELKPLLLYNTCVPVPFMVIVGNIIAQRERVEDERSEARAEAREARTRLLQSQLHPHVLFNALNGLLELIRRDAGAAEQCVRSMSDLLRMLLQASEQSFFPLAQERRIVEHYLALEQLRLGERLRVRWEWPEGWDQLLVPPLLLQPLVENAIKHGVSPSIEGGELRISLEKRPEGLRLEARNTGEPLQEGWRSGGIGVRNLEARLKLAFGGAACFSLRSEGGWTCAAVDFPLPEEA